MIMRFPNRRQKAFGIKFYGRLLHGDDLQKLEEEGVDWGGRGRLAMGARVTNGLTPEQQKERLEIVRGEAERAHDRNDRFFKQANKSAIDLATLTVRRTGKSNRRARA